MMCFLGGGWPKTSGSARDRFPPMTFDRKGELVAFCRSASGIRRAAMVLETSGEGGRARAICEQRSARGWRSVCWEGQVAHDA
jgi:hypothetical protein